MSAINTLREGNKEVLKGYISFFTVEKSLHITIYFTCLLKDTEALKHIETARVWRKACLIEYCSNGFMGYQDHLLILAVSLLSFSVFVYFVYISHSPSTLGHKLPIIDQIYWSKVKSIS